MKRLRRCIVGLVAAWSGAAQAQATTSVDPGGLVVWQAAGPATCKLAGRSWPATASGACVFPVDLYTPAGPLVVTRATSAGEVTRTVSVNPYPYPTQVVDFPDDSKVNLSAADLARVDRDNAMTAKLWPLETSTVTPGLPVGKPLESLPAGGRFGSRRIFNGQPRNNHSGSDYSVAKGTPVLAIAAGKVVLADEHFFAGNSVFVDHGQGLISMYFHLDKILATEGTVVAAGQKIGEVGATGRATGPHLHFGARWHGQRINPELLFRAIQDLPTLK